jgi:hypothetical protein
MSDVELLNKFVPIFYLHSKEKYFPSDINFMLDNSVLVENNVVIDTKVTSKKLYDYTNTNFPGQTGIDWQKLRIEFPDSILGGFQGEKLQDAPVYGLVNNRLPDTIELYYLMVFPYNGPRKILGIQDAGQHYGDIEHVTIELDKTSKNPIRMYFGAHGDADGKWIDWKDVQKVDQTHPIVLLALEGHGAYPEEGYAYRIFGLANDEVDYGTKWTPKVVQIFTRNEPGFNPETMGWLYFAGRFGRDGIGFPGNWRIFKSQEIKSGLMPPKFKSHTTLVLEKLSRKFGWILFFTALILFGFWQRKINVKLYFGLLAVIVAIVIFKAKKLIASFG